MKPNKTSQTLNTEQAGQEPTDQADEPISKTKRKAAMDELQDIGATLIELPKEKLAKLDLPEILVDAIREAKRITANGATRRQLQYIGRIMRNVDTAPILDQLQRWEGKHTAENAYFHGLESWRDRMIADSNVLSEFIARYPKTDIQQ
ncbi:MAG: ribosome biogenesis factor YjgA, partial [Methylophilaceae bacterium]